MRDRLRLMLLNGLVLATGVTFGQTGSAAQTASVPPAAATQAAPAQAGPVAAQAAPTPAAPVASAAAPASSSASSANLTFDVASVRPSEQLDQAKMMAAMQSGKMPRFGAHIDGLRAEYSQMPLKELVANAYEVKPYQVTGPDFMNGQRFDIAAKMPEGSTREDAPKMLRALLVERFKLEAQMKTEDHPIYALVVGKGGAKLKESAEKPVAIDPNAELKAGEMKMDIGEGPMILKQNPDGSTAINMGEQGRYVQRFDMQSKMMHLDGSAISTKGLAEMLTRMMMSGADTSGRQVFDKTDLKGYYDVSLDFSIANMFPNTGGTGGSATEASDPGGGGATLFDSVKKMGLKLDPSKAQVAQVSVAHVEKMPTDN